MIEQTPALLAVSQLDVRYGQARALFGIDLELRSGRVLALLGPNGAGKSSLAAAISGRVRPAAGRVCLAGRDVTGYSAHRLSRLGVAYVPEERAIFPHLSVADNLRVRLRYAVPRAERRDALERALEMFPVLASRPGQRQRIALARAFLRAGSLAPPAGLVLLDEPTAGLDGESEAAVLAASTELVAGYLGAVGGD